MTKQDNKFVSGQSGNPKGRPIGSRNKLSTAFLDDMLADWQLHGKAAIAKVREEKPDQYLKVVASILPKDINLDFNQYENYTDDELKDRLHELNNELKPLFNSLGFDDDSETTH